MLNSETNVLPKDSSLRPANKPGHACKLVRLHLDLPPPCYPCRSLRNVLPARRDKKMKPFFTRVARPLLVVALLGVALTAVAYAHGSDLALIHACVNNNSGEIKIVGANETCRQNETPLDWNIQGPPGPQGIQGAPGVASPIVR